jgi:putative ABC transport system permease protein
VLSLTLSPSVSFIPGRNAVYVEVKGIIKQTLGLNAYMDIGFMGEKLLEKNTVNGIYLNSNDEEIYEELARATQIATVMSIEDTRSIFEEYMGIMNAMIVFMVFFSGILGFCIVYNATTIIIGEREMEFSALRVLGLSKNEIFKMVLNENNILMIFGIAVGIPLGMAMLTSLSEAVSTDMYAFYMTPNLKSITYAAALTALFVFFAQLAAYQKIKRLDLLSALKNRMS